MAKDITEKNRLVYIDPNEYAGLLAKENNPDLENSTMLSWNPEELSMSVDLQVIIPRRADAGQISYRVNVDGSDISFNGGLSNRYVSYLGGTEYDNTKESFLTDDFLNISYQEVFNDKVVDKESLGINSIDISFDSHFFPIVNIHFTDVRGASLFMPMEQEFYQSVTDKKDIKQTTSSFFKALFHFPYPRFLLSVKGFYGTKVTFQLAVSDFKSNFQPETGNYDITVQFIGYVYGLYTDLPFNLIMAAPYYNSGYWQDKKSSGVFRYVDNGQAGGEMLTYVEFLSKMEGKKIDKDSLVGANETKSYLKTKEAIKALKEIPELYRKACFSTPVKENGTTYYYTKRSSAVQTFIWGLQTHKKNGENNATNVNGGFHFNEEASLELYKALQKIYTDFPEYKDLVDTNNIFIESWNNKKINGKNLNSDTIANDKELKYATLFSYVKPKDTKTLDKFFEFYENGATIEGKKIDGNFYIEKNVNFFNAIGDDTEFKKTFVTFNNGNSLMLAGDPDYLTVITNTKNEEGKIKYNKENTYGVIVKVEDYCAGISAQIVQLEDDLKTLQTKVADELKEVYKNVIGFEPTVENYYRMLFAHIDCFMNYYTGKVLKEVSDDYNKQKRTLKELGITVDDTDLPKEFKKGDINEISVYPFPAYYTKSSQRMSSKIVADYPGYASGTHAKFANIPEVKAVDNILKGIETLKVEYEAAVGGSGAVLTENIFSPLSILYNFQNPWNTLDIKGTNDDKDILKIIYFYMSLLYADKVIGTNTDRSDMKDVTPYKKQLANLLMDKIGGNVTSTFMDSLAQMINRVNEPNGLNYIIDNTKNDYHLNNFKSSGNDIFVYNKTKNGGNGLTVFKVDNDALTKEASTLDYDKYYITGGGKKGSDKNRIISFSSEGFLSDYDNTQLKNFNNSLIKIGEGSEYLSDRDGKIVLGDYCNSLLLEKPYETDGINPLVGFNKDNYIVFQAHKEETIDTNVKDTLQYTISKQVIDKMLKIENINNVLYDDLTNVYKENATNKHINFVGRKISGLKEVETDGYKYKADINTSVSLFSGIKEYVVDENKIMCSIESNGNNVIITYPKIISRDFDDILPLLFSKRCGGSEINNYQTSDENIVKKVYTKTRTDLKYKYAFATYFLGTLCGPSSLKSIVDRFNDNFSLWKKTNVIRKAELLYLAGSLYFAKNDLNLWNEEKRRIICDVICSDGTLGRGLLKEDVVKDSSGNIIDKYNTNQNGIDVNTLFFEGIADKLIEYFEDWCQNELFGGKNMYDLLIQVSSENTNEYITLNGYAAYNNGIEDTKQYSLVQGYTTGGECEKWLTDLVCSYGFVMTFYSNFNTATGTTITKKEITDFLSYIYDDLKKQKEDREERVRAFEEGRSNSIGEDLRRATYYLLKNLYDKWLCTYTAKEFELHDPVVDLNMRKERFSGLKLDMPNYSEYNNFIYIDQFYRDISSSYLLDSDLMAKTIKDIYKGRSNMDIYTLMSYMAEKNNLMLLALPVYTNMYNAENVRRVFTPNTLYGANGGDNCNGVGTTYVVMHTSEPSHNPGEFGSYDYSGDYIDIADLKNNNGPVDLELFGKTNNTNASDLDYTVTAFGVEYSKQNQMYFKRVNVNMDNPKVTNEAIKNMFILADGGSQGTTDQPIAIGQNIYSIYANRSYTCTVEMLGCMNIMPMMYFNLNNVPMFRGLYMIINVKHSIKAGDITTIFTGVRVNRYALPDVTDMMLNSSLFDSIAENRDSWKDGKAISNCEDPCPTVNLDEKIGSFTLRELTHSDKAEEKNLCNNPSYEDIENLRKLVTNILDPLKTAWRDFANDDLKLNSVFRSKCVNSAVGGGENSDHLYGFAADIKPKTIGRMAEFKEFVKRWLYCNKKEFKQFIDEKDGNSQWVHISYQEGKNRKEFLTYDSARRKPKYWKIPKSDLDKLCETNNV